MNFADDTQEGDEKEPKELNEDVLDETEDEGLLAEEEEAERE